MDINLNVSFGMQVDAHSNLGNIMKAQGLVQDVSLKNEIQMQCIVLDPTILAKKTYVQDPTISLYKTICHPFKGEVHLFMACP